MSPSRFIPAVAFCGAIFFAAVAADVRTSPQIAALDRALASAGPEARVICLGDMALPRAVVESARRRLTGEPVTDSAFAGGVTLWPGGVVPYDFDAGVSAEHQRAFVDAANDWSTFAAVTFVPRTTQADYVHVQNMPSGGGFSAVGKVGGAQDFRIGPFAWNRGTLTHELGHTLGLVHEHQRSDRDNFVVLFPANLPGGVLDGNYVLLTTSDNQGAYDFLSIMHYSRLQASTNGQDTMRPQPAYTSFLDTMGNNPDRTLSALDRQKMALKYGVGPAQSAVVRNTQDSGAGSLRAAIYYAFDHPNTTITFAIPPTDPGFASGVFTIQPSDIMTRLAAGTVIDGTTQAGWSPGVPVVGLSGAFSLAENFYFPGLRLAEANCSVRALLIGGFRTYGIEISGSGAVANTVSGCWIGTDATGAASAANDRGVGLILGANNNVIGGVTPAARNVISGNTNQGIAMIDPGTTANQVLGNYLGVNAAGTAALPNAVGVGIFGGASGNFVGGSAAGTGNLVSGNSAQGILLSDTGTNANIVRGNRVGTNPAGTAALGNGNGGITIYTGAQSNVIGGSAAGAGNLASGNVGDGIFVGFAGANLNQILGNLAGTNASGTGAVPNTGAGISLYAGPQFNVVGGAAPGAGNLASGNTGDGIFVGFAGTSQNTVIGNRVGLNLTGTAALPNQGSGISVYSGATSNLIGGSTPGTGNVASGNTHDGIFLGFAGTNFNTVSGNLVGLDPTGLVRLANGGSGVALYAGVQFNVIGGGIGARNWISGNNASGVVLSFSDTKSNSVLGNVIGLNVSGAAVGNTSNGVELFAGAQNNSIGGISPGEGNLISGNGFDGIVSYDATTFGNVYRRNQIYGNANAGLELVTGSNQNALAPVLTSASLGLGTTVQGSSSGTPGNVRVEFFATPPANSAGGAGRYFIGEATPAASNFGVTLPATVPAGHLVTATATDTNAGNTSAFSNPVPVTVVDTLGDGIPDVWRVAYFGANWPQNPQAGAGADPDGDGLSNLAEFRAGLFPNNASSRLTLTTARSLADELLSFPSVSGIQYQVQTSESLTDGWRALATPISGTGLVLSLSDPGAATRGKRFYRLVVVP